MIKIYRKFQLKLKKTININIQMKYMSIVLIATENFFKGDCNCI